ncbi:MAG: MFS transporter [Magnetovibrio sp.]|nr:MFS transporter [Magnetovibrio sp.]
MTRPEPSAIAFDRPQRSAFWKIAGAGATFQAGSTAVDSATIVATLVYHLTGSVYAVGAASTVLRLGWLLPQLMVGFLAQKSSRRMPYYIFGACGRALCILAIALLLANAGAVASAWVGAAFMILWTLYAFVSGVVAVPYNDIVGRSITSELRSRMLAWRFFGGSILALLIAAFARYALQNSPLLDAYALIFALAAALMVVSTLSFVCAGEPPTATPSPAQRNGFGQFLKDGWQVLHSDARFRLFLYSQWLSGATLMALPFYVIAASGLGLPTADVAILLGAQTAGALLCNPIWGRIGDHLGKLRLLQAVGILRLTVPLAAMLILATTSPASPWIMPLYSLLFVAMGALSNGMTIAYLGYLMEVSPDDKRPAYSAYFNALASPAALLPLVGAAIADSISLHLVFLIALLAAVAQLVLYAKMAVRDANIP